MRNCFRAVAAGIAAVFASASTGGWASGFQLMEQNASGLGNAYAGQAAAAADASTIFFNPAGLTRLPGGNVVGAVHAITPSIKFNNTGSALPAPHALGGNGGDAGGLVWLPNGYISYQIAPSVWLGLGLSVPFGLKTEYDANFIGRFQGVRSEIKTVDVNPTIAFKINDNWSVGAGISWQKVNAELTSGVNLGATAGSALIEVDDSKWGFNLGVMYNMSDNTRVGVSYRSVMDYELTGTATIHSATGTAILATPVGVRADAKLPDTYSAAFSHTVQRWQALADFTYTRWNTLQSIAIRRDDTGGTLDTLNLKFRNSWRIGLGLNYFWNEAFTLRLGAAYDKSPVEDAFRTVRLPDKDRTWLAIGGQYRINKAVAVDFGYAHLFINDPSIANLQGTAPGQKGNVVGDYDNDINILSVQFTYAF